MSWFGPMIVHFTAKLSFSGGFLPAEQRVQRHQNGDGVLEGDDSWTALKKEGLQDGASRHGTPCTFRLLFGDPWMKTSG